MLSYAKVIGRLSKLSVNLHKPPNLHGVPRLSIIRCKNTTPPDKKPLKTGATATVEECTPQKNPSKKLAACEDPNYICPPECQETCNVPNDKTGRGSLIDYWKHLLAAVLLTGFTIYLTSELTNQTSKDVKKKKKKSKIIKVPLNSVSIPKEIPYLLIGGGTASFSAFRSIKSKEPTAKVLVVTTEQNLPYMRPPLSKELWYSKESDKTKTLMFRQWNGSRRSLFYEPAEFFMDVAKLANSERGGISVITGWKVDKIDAINKIATLDDGHTIKYDKCLIATGASPKTPPIFENADEDVKSKIIIYRTIEDYIKLDTNLKDPKVKNIVIIGGGFLGSELACSLVQNLDKEKKSIYHLIKEKSVMAQILPEYLGNWLTEKLSREGVNIIPNVEVEDYSYVNGKLILKGTNGQTFEADQVIVAAGVEPNTQLADTSGLEVDPEIGGFLVNAELQARSDLWVAGDAACFYDVNLGRRRVEHHDHAVVSGKLAGENMTGANKPYLHQSMFWSDLGTDVGYEAIGIIDSSLQTVGVFAIKSGNDKKENEKISDESDSISSNKELVVKTPDAHKPPTNICDYGKGVVFYLRNNTIVGIVLWNIYNRTSVARQILSRGLQYEDCNEVAKLFAIHEE